MVWNQWDSQRSYDKFKNAKKKIKGIEIINTLKIVDNLVDEWVLPYKNKVACREIVSKVFNKIKEEVVSGKKVNIHWFGGLYPNVLKDRSYYIPRLKRHSEVKKNRVTIKFMQSDWIRPYLAANFKWVKWKDPKK